MNAFYPYLELFQYQILDYPYISELPSGILSKTISEQRLLVILKKLNINIKFVEKHSTLGENYFEIWMSKKVRDQWGKSFSWKIDKICQQLCLEQQQMLLGLSLACGCCLLKNHLFKDDRQLALWYGDYEIR